MSIDINELAMDLDTAREGKWVTYKGSDFELKIASTKSNRLFDKHRRSLLKGKRHRSSQANMSERDAKLLIAPAVANHVVKDWRGLSENGVDSPYSSSKCLEMISDDRFIDLFEFIMEVATDGDEYLSMLEDSEEN